MEIFLSNYATIDTEELNKRKRLIDEQTKEIELLKEKLEEYFKFEIPNYIIMDIIENEEYKHFCLMVNLAVANNRLSNKDGEILKDGIKDIFNIKNDYDKLNKMQYITSNTKDN